MLAVNNLFMSIYLDIQEYDNRIEKMHTDLDDAISRIQDCKHICSFYEYQTIDSTSYN